MNKIQLIPILSLVLIFSGCDYIKQKMNQSKDKSDTELTTAWSCSEKDDLAQINEYLKQQFIRNLDRNLREYSYYTAEKEIQNTIVNNIRFEIKQVRTLNDENTSSSQLSCESQLIAYLPKGLQKRAENAYVELYRGSEEEEMPLTLQDYIDSNSLVLEDDQLKGHLNYFITKTDHDGITLQVQNESFVLDELIFISRLAIQYAAYIQENKNYQQEVSESVSREVEQTNLAQRALDIRKKELETEKKQKVERLNQIWDNFDAEKKAQLQADQAEWFEKRDVDCKITAQKSIHDIDSKDRETYQEHYQYWTESMRKQNQELEYNKCFIQRTTERSIYLQNLL